MLEVSQGSTFRPKRDPVANHYLWAVLASHLVKLSGNVCDDVAIAGTIDHLGGVRHSPGPRVCHCGAQKQPFEARVVARERGYPKRRGNDFGRRSTKYGRGNCPHSRGNYAPHPSSSGPGLAGAATASDGQPAREDRRTPRPTPPSFSDNQPKQSPSKMHQRAPKRGHSYAMPHAARRVDSQAKTESFHTSCKLRGPKEVDDVPPTYTGWGSYCSCGLAQARRPLGLSYLAIPLSPTLFPIPECPERPLIVRALPDPRSYRGCW